MALALSACGDDDTTNPPDARVGVDSATPMPDADPGAPDAGTGGPLTGGEFDDPSDFDRIDCVAGSMAGLDPGGMWHQDTALVYPFGGDPYLWNDAIKFEPRANGSFRGRRGKQLTTDVRVTDDDLFVRWVYQGSNGTLNVVTFDACRQEADGSVSGYLAQCNSSYYDFFGDPCVKGTFHGVRVERIPGEAESQGLTLLGEFRGPAFDPWAPGVTVNVRVRDNVAYVARHTDGLRIVDVSDPANMQSLGRQYRLNGYNDVKIVDGPGGRIYALASSDYIGVDSIDVTDPAAPSIDATFAQAGGVHTIATETLGGVTTVYLVNGETGGLSVYDVTDPAVPTPLGEFVHPDVETMGGFIHDLSVLNGIVYLNYWGLGFVVVDATDPTSISMIGQFDDYARRSSHSSWVTTINGCLTAVHGDEDFHAHLRTIGVDPACPATFMQQIGELSLRPEVSIHNILAFGTTAYIAWYQDGIRMIDLSDPAAPVLSGYFNTWDGRLGESFFEGALGIDVDLANGLVYVAEQPRGLLVLEITP